MTNGWGRWGDHKVACRAVDPEEFFGGAAQQSRVKSVCTGCRVRVVCLAEALDNRMDFGVWGGMTARERGALLRQRPDVRSWRMVLERALDSGEEVFSSSS